MDAAAAGAAAGAAAAASAAAEVATTAIAVVKTIAAAEAAEAAAEADLVPFVLEALGRPGESAIALLRSVAPVEQELRGPVLGAAWQSLSAILQEELAEALLTASVEGFQFD